MDTRQNPRARRFAFEMIKESDPKAAAVLIPGMLNDPSVELRRSSVQLLINKGVSFLKSNENNAAILVFRQALGAARDVDQTRQLSDHLKDLKQKVDLPRHFGFLMDWKIIGPFDNTDYKGFSEVYAPERMIDLSASYPGKNKEATWKDFRSEDEFGMIDINKVCGLLKETTAYAYTEFYSEKGGPVELRLGSKNGWKVWLNGEFLFGRDEYHRNMKIDQYQLPGQLNPGKNTILVKACQNEQIETWTVEWQFQLRVCDSSGTAILSTDR